MLTVYLPKPETKEFQGLLIAQNKDLLARSRRLFGREVKSKKKFYTIRVNDRSLEAKKQQIQHILVYAHNRNGDYGALEGRSE